MLVAKDSSDREKKKYPGIAPARYCSSWIVPSILRGEKSSTVNPLGYIWTLYLSSPLFVDVNRWNCLNWNLQVMFNWSALSTPIRRLKVSEVVVVVAYCRQLFSLQFQPSGKSILSAYISHSNFLPPHCLSHSCKLAGNWSKGELGSCVLSPFKGINYTTPNKSRMARFLNRNPGPRFPSLSLLYI